MLCGPGCEGPHQQLGVSSGLFLSPVRLALSRRQDRQGDPAFGKTGVSPPDGSFHNRPYLAFIRIHLSAISVPLRESFPPDHRLPDIPAALPESRSIRLSGLAVGCAPVCERRTGGEKRQDDLLLRAHSAACSLTLPRRLGPPVASRHERCSGRRARRWVLPSSPGAGALALPTSCSGAGC